jgi:secondary thiamine-phosphate synthase enzyme
MTIKTEYLELCTKGNTDIFDITPQVAEKLSFHKIKNGIVTISVIGSTGGLTTCEYEPGLVADLKELFKKLIPEGSYHHDQAWGDGNGHAHLRASLLGPSLTVPFREGQLILGTWQQIIFLDFDNRSRKRKIVVQILGE